MSKRRFLKATEVERLFEQARENDTQFSEGETSIIRTIIETAKRNGRIGDKILLVVPPRYIHIPTWQRSADLSRARAIGNEYNKYKWEVPKIVFVEGRLICVDGMHRILGALLANIPDIVVEVMEISEREAIELFLNQTVDRSSMKPADYYRASIEAEKPDYIGFRNVCHKYNVQVKGDDTLANPVGIFTSISDGTRANKEVLDKVLNLINVLGWNGKETCSLNPSSAAYGAKVIRTLSKLYAVYQGHEDKMETVLVSRCSGTEFFIKNLSDEPQYRIFDLLNTTIKNGAIKSLKEINSKTA